MQWVEKHRPTCFTDIKGQREAIEKVKNFLQEFNLGRLTKIPKKAVILHGPPGTGKTTIAHVAAIETQSEIFELNASDLRNKSKLQEILKPAIEQKSLIKNRKIILVDEVDGISAVDRGGLTELLFLINLTSYPIIITANDVWNKKFSTLRKKTELIRLREIDYRTIKDVLICILRKENKFVENDVLTKIAINANGDLRAAMNDIQVISAMKQQGISKAIDGRNKETDIFSALRLVFRGKPSFETLNVFDSVNMPIDEIILWIEENIPTEYQGEELARAYERLSKVDIFKGRIYKQQYWRFLLYENILLSYGISASKNPEKATKTGFTNYKKPDRILKIWLNNQKTVKIKSIAKKYARHAHIGEKRAIKEFPIIREILRLNPVTQKELRLNEEEIEYLNKVI